MKKWIIAGGVIVVLVIVLLIVGVSNLGPMIKSGVNNYGPGITKTEVRLGDVDVSIFSGEAKLKDFYLGNPKGFKSSQAVRVGAIHVDVDEKSLITGDTIIIDRIEVAGPDITYEKTGGTDNFKAILDNVKRTVGKGDKKRSSGEKDRGKKILIRNFIVRNGKVNLTMPALGGKTISASLPDIHLRDVGQKSNGASPAEVFKEIFTAMYEKITSPAVTGIFNRGLKDLGVGMEEVAENAKKSLGAVTDNFKGLFGK